MFNENYVVEKVHQKRITYSASGRLVHELLVYWQVKNTLDALLLSLSCVSSLGDIYVYIYIRLSEESQLHSQTHNTPLSLFI